MEKILRIEEATFKDTSKWGGYDGYQIITDKQTIKLGISNGQGCCETWGYFITNDEIKDFIGATVNGINLVDTCLNVNKAPDRPGEYFEGGIMYVNIETDKGTLQFTAYNCHNGYYGHEAVVVSSQLNAEEYL